ncbi:MAG: 30S ribosomal protein S2 [Methyloligellaceae bacterium]
MALPTFNMRELLEAGVHFGHQKHRWNPKMGSYIFGTRNNIHIIDLAQTVPLLHQAIVKVSDVVAKGGRVLFVGTKRQATDAVSDSAKQCAQYFVNHRWLGGTLTNWKTISNSIRQLRTLEERLEGETHGLTKKELLKLTLERDKLERSLGGIKDMGGIPDILFVVDTNKESIAVAEAKKLKIPVIGIVDSNSDPDVVNIPIPGNDDASRAISLYCDLIARAAIDGIERGQVDSGIDIGAAEAPMEQSLGDDSQQAPEAKETPASEAEDVKTQETQEAKPEEVKANGVDTEAKAEEVQVSAFKGLDALEGEADDLKKISGVGPVLEEKLNSMGIYHYRQIAAFTPEDIAAVDDALKFKGRIERDDWLAQAKKLAEEAA